VPHDPEHRERHGTDDRGEGEGAVIEIRKALAQLAVALSDHALEQMVRAALEEAK
jgi:hypothetical protein